MDRYTGPTENLKSQILALVQPDRVHRDLYLSDEVFRLEQEHFFANTWNYVGHDSQIPKAGDYLTVDIGGRPLIVVRHSDDSVRVLMNRCAHKGSRVVSAPCGNTGKVFRCPYHAWTFRTDGSLLNFPVKEGYEGTAVRECESGKGLVAVQQRARLPRLRLRQDQRRRPELRGVLRRLAQLHRQHGRPLARGRTGDRRRLPALPAQLQLEDVHREPQRHHAPDGGARVVRRHRGEDVDGQAGRRAQADGHRAVRALHVGLQVLRRHGRARVRQRPQLLGRQLQHPLQVLRRAGLRRSDGQGLRRAARARHPGADAAQHRVLPEPDDQGRDPGDPRGQADRGGQDAHRKLDLPPEGRAARAAAAHGDVQRG